MRLAGRVRPDDIEAALPQAVVATRIVALGLCGGVATFSVVVLVLSARVGPPEPAQGAAGVLAALSLVDAVFALAAYALSGVLYGSMLTPERLEAAAGGEPAPGESEGRALGRRVVAAIQTAMILRFAVLESAAIMGLAACLIGVFNGGLRAQPLYWLNAVPAGLFLAYVLSHLPEPERFREVFREKVQGGGGG